MKIYKYTIRQQSGIQAVEVSGIERVLSAMEQDGKMVLYVIVDEKKETLNKFISVAVIPTGGDVAEVLKDGFKFINTINIGNGLLMWHIFYKIIL